MTNFEVENADFPGGLLGFLERRHRIFEKFLGAALIYVRSC